MATITRKLLFPMEPGTRRSKLAGYIQSAQELRQTYQASYAASRGASSIRAAKTSIQYLGQPWGHHTSGENQLDGPDELREDSAAALSAVRIQLFPAQVRRILHPNRKTINRPDQTLDAQQSENNTSDSAGLATVEAEVNGWVSIPHTGPPTRKQRLFIGIVRQLARDAGSNLNSGTSEERFHDKQDDYGSNSGCKDHLMENLSPFLDSPACNQQVLGYFYDGDPEDPSVRVATCSTYSGPTGKFTLAIKLEFDPVVAHVRIPNHASPDSSASFSSSRLRNLTPSPQTLSLPAPLDPEGISVISDIDDTLKHTSGGNGTMEAFRQTLGRDPRLACSIDAAVEGVPTWFQALKTYGVAFHYVSNSPWQLQRTHIGPFFEAAGIPSGSMHLRDYRTGGIWRGLTEPTVDRKRPILEQIGRDHPRRKFILIGDSIEADLEIYTEYALQNPGRVIGIFIRDLTRTISSQSLRGSSAEVSHEFKKLPRMGSLSSMKRLTNRSTSSSRASSSSDHYAEDSPPFEETKGGLDNLVIPPTSPACRPGKSPASAPSDCGSSSPLQNAWATAEHGPNHNLEELDHIKPCRTVPVILESNANTTRNRLPIRAKPPFLSGNPLSHNNSRRPKLPPIPVPPLPPRPSRCVTRASPPRFPSGSPEEPRKPKDQSGIISEIKRAAEGPVATKCEGESPKNAAVRTREVRQASTPNSAGDEESQIAGSVSFGGEKTPPNAYPSNKTERNHGAMQGQGVGGPTANSLSMPPVSGSDGACPTMQVSPLLNYFKQTQNIIPGSIQQAFPQRWVRALNSLQNSGIVLRVWRVGQEVQDECLDLVKNKMEELLGE